MENPMTWGPVQKSISKNLHLTSREIVLGLERDGLLQPETDIPGLISRFDTTRKAFQERLDKGFCGLSLQSTLAKLI